MGKGRRRRAVLAVGRLGISYTHIAGPAAPVRSAEAITQVGTAPGKRLRPALSSGAVSPTRASTRRMRHAARPVGNLDDAVLTRRRWKHGGGHGSPTDGIDVQS
jgi:hypothetical protein